MPDAKRTQLKKKIEAGEARNKARGQPTFVDKAGEKAIEAKDKFTAFAREHPIATVAGGLAAGILISALFKRSPTRKIGNRAAKAASGLAATGAEFALGYALQAWEAANEAGRASAEKLEEIGTAARSARREAAGRASELGTAARSKTRGAGKRLREALNGRNT